MCSLIDTMELVDAIKRNDHVYVRDNIYGYTASSTWMARPLLWYVAELPFTESKSQPVMITQHDTTDSDFDFCSEDVPEKLSVSMTKQLSVPQNLIFNLFAKQGLEPEATAIALVHSIEVDNHEFYQNITNASILLDHRVIDAIFKHNMTLGVSIFEHVSSLLGDRRPNWEIKALVNKKPWLENAVRMHCNLVVEQLLKLGAIPTMDNRDGFSAVHVAIDSLNYAALRMFDLKELTKQQYDDAIVLAVSKYDATFLSYLIKPWLLQYKLEMSVFARIAIIIDYTDPHSTQINDLKIMTNMLLPLRNEQRLYFNRDEVPESYRYTKLRDTWFNWLAKHHTNIE